MTSSDRVLQRFGEIPPTKEAYLDYGPSVPARYGVVVVRLFVRDPECVYAFWEGGTTLRIRDLTSGGERWLDVAEVGSWFGVAEPEHEYEAEVGRREDGRFVVAARSNRVRTPRRGPAVEIDPEWAPSPAELEQLRALCGRLALRLPTSR